MSKYDSFLILWKFMDLSEKKRLMHQFTKKHGNHFTRDEFFEFLASKYQSDRIRFETNDGEPINGKVAA